jgi:hypothetical protein
MFGWFCCVKRTGKVWTAEYAYSILSYLIISYSCLYNFVYMLVQCLRNVYFIGVGHVQRHHPYSKPQSRTRRTPRLHPDPRSRGGWPMWPMWPGRPGIRGRVLNAAAILQIPCTIKFLNSITVVTTIYIIILCKTVINLAHFRTFSEGLAVFWCHDSGPSQTQCGTSHLLGCSRLSRRHGRISAPC